MNVQSFINQYQEVMIEALRALIREPRVSSTGEGMEQHHDLLLDIMRDVGIEPQVHTTPGYPIITGTIAGRTDKTLMVYGHYDVQPAEPLDEWDYPPFGAERVDDRIYGRGAIDDKGNFMTAIQALRYYREQGQKPPINVTFVLEGEEEIGSPHLEDFLQAHRDELTPDSIIGLDDCVQPDGRPKVVLGLKGGCTLELVAHGKTQFHSLMAAIIENPAWRLFWALGTMKRPDGEITIDGFLDDVRPPTEMEQQLVDALDYDGKEWLEASGRDAFLGGKTGNAAMHDFFFKPTCNVAGIIGGYTGPGFQGVIPRTVTVKMDLRLVPNQSPDRVAQQVRDHLRRRGFSDIEVNYLKGGDWFRTAPDAPIVQCLTQSVDQVFDEGAAVWVTYAGGGPASKVDRVFGVPQVASGFGPVGDRIHTPNEYMTVDLYLKGIQTMIHTFDAYART